MQKSQKKRFILCIIKNYPYLCIAFKKCTNMVAVVQLVRASDCGSECRGFESHLPPAKEEIQKNIPLFCYYPHPARERVSRKLGVSPKTLWVC